MKDFCIYICHMTNIQGANMKNTVAGKSGRWVFSAVALGAETAPATKGLRRSALSAN